MIVKCDTSVIGIDVPMCAFYNERISDFVFLDAGENCTIENNGVEYQMAIPTSPECGTRITRNDTYIVFANAIVGSIGGSNGVITRKKTIEVEFSCGYEARVLEIIHLSVESLQISKNSQSNNPNIETFDFNFYFEIIFKFLENFKKKIAKIPHKNEVLIFNTSMKHKFQNSI